MKIWPTHSGLEAFAAEGGGGDVEGVEVDVVDVVVVEEGGLEGGEGGLRMDWMRSTKE